MFGMFKKKSAAVKVELKKVENRDLMEAIVGGCLLVAVCWLLLLMVKLRKKKQQSSINCCVLIPA